MTDRDKIAHLLRRFGLGAGRYELKRYESLGYRGTLEKLLNDDEIDERFPINPWELAAQEDGRIETNSYVVASWWALRLLMTRRPLQEKLAFFWHSHFALSAEKVYEAPTMIGYLYVLRTQGRGKFSDLISAVYKQGAMLTYLDGHTSSRVHPNENLARETLELFTIGEGKFSEEDVRELARALTGWSMHYLGLGLEEKYEVTAKRARDNRMAMSNFCSVPALHDHGMKTILGRSAAFDGDSALAHIASLPQTAEFICRKLWAFFAYPEPDSKVLGRLTNVWRKSGGEIKSVLREIALSHEFLSEKCVGQMPKSPMDWMVALYRGLDIADLLLLMRGTPKTDITPLKKGVREAGGGLHYLMAQQGLSLLYPPDVSGWKVGEAWITSDNTVRRLQTADVLFWGGGEDRPMAVLLANRMKKEDKVTDSAGIVDAFADIFDFRLLPEHRESLIQRTNQAGGISALDNKDRAAGLFANLAKSTFAIPASQLC